MNSLKKQIEAYRKEMKRESIPNTYRTLLSYVRVLKNHLARHYPSYTLSSGIYQGEMDITYFTFTPPTLKEKKLKIALVFVHETIRWELWLL